MSSLLKKMCSDTKIDSDIEGGKRKSRKMRQKKRVIDPIPNFTNDSFINYTIPTANKSYLNDVLVNGQTQSELDFTYNAKNTKEFNKSFQQSFVMNIPTIKSLFEFILRKTDLGNPPIQELYDKTRQLYLTLQKMYSALDDSKDTAYLFDQKNREQIDYTMKLLFDFEQQMSYQSASYRGRLVKSMVLTNIVGDDSEELGKLVTALYNMIQYTKNVFESQGVPIQQGGSKVEEDLGMIKFPPAKNPVLIPPSKFMEYDLVIPEPVPLKIIDPLGVSQFHFDFPYENVDSRQYFNNPTMFPIIQ